MINGNGLTIMSDMLIIACMISFVYPSLVFGSLTMANTFTQEIRPKRNEPTDRSFDFREYSAATR